LGVKGSFLLSQQPVDPFRKESRVLLLLLEALAHERRYCVVRLESAVVRVFLQGLNA
jgi:hypothetical protein